MTDFPASTPELTAYKAAADAFFARDLDNAGTFLSKDFVFRTFPKHPDHPDEPKEEHIKKRLAMFASLTDMKVGIQHQRITFERRLIHAISSLRPSR